MKIETIRFQYVADSVEADIFMLEVDSHNDLKQIKEKQSPAIYVVQNESLKFFTQFESLLVNRGGKHESRELKKLLLGKEKIPYIYYHYLKSGQALRSLEALMKHAAVKEKNLYFILVDPDMYRQLEERIQAESLKKKRGSAVDGNHNGKWNLKNPDAPVYRRMFDLLQRPDDELLNRIAKKYIGKSPEIELVRRLIALACKHNDPMLILGESGTGKELVALAIHENGLRKNKEMIVVNCGAIPSELLESELFGSERGSHSTAFKRKIGLWELAKDGTLFLDEIGELIPSHQAKILRALGEGKFYRVGGTEPIEAHPRLIAATNRDLFAMTQRGEFREDLYYRLLSFEIRTPALRDIPNDIPLLAQTLWKAITDPENQLPEEEKRKLPPDVVRELRKYSWPGNVRELKNVLRSLNGYFGNDKLGPKHLTALLQFERCVSVDKDRSARNEDAYREKAEWLRCLKRLDAALAALKHVIEPMFLEKKKKPPRDSGFKDNLGHAIMGLALDLIMAKRIRLGDASNLLNKLYEVLIKLYNGLDRMDDKELTSHGDRVLKQLDTARSKVMKDLDEIIKKY